MPREKLFHFVPLKKGEKNKKRQVVLPMVYVSTTMQMTFTPSVMRELLGKTPDTVLLRLYGDDMKKALAFQFVDSYTGPSMPENMRAISAVKKDGQIQRYALSIGSFLSRIKWEHDRLPIKLEVKSYNDTDETAAVGEVFYVEFPPRSRFDKPKEVNPFLAPPEK